MSVWPDAIRRFGDPQRVDAGLFLAHEGAGCARDAVHDGDVAGEQVRELRQEQRRPQVAHQALVEERAPVGGAPQPGQDLRVDGRVALAAAGRHDELHLGLQLGIVLDAGRVECGAGRVHPEALPRIHLTLVGLLGDLPVPLDRDGRMNRERREALAVHDRRMPLPQGGEMRLGAFAAVGQQPDTRDDDVAPHQGAASNESPIWPARCRISPLSPAGNGMVRKRNSALATSAPSCRIDALVTA